MDGLLLGLDGLGVLLLLGETATDGASLLVTEVEGNVLRLLVELAEVLALLLVDDGQDTGDRLADSVAEGLARTRRDRARRCMTSELRPDQTQDQTFQRSDS